MGVAKPEGVQGSRFALRVVGGPPERGVRNPERGAKSKGVNSALRIQYCYLPNPEPHIELRASAFAVLRRDGQLAVPQVLLDHVGLARTVDQCADFHGAPAVVTPFTSVW